MNTDHIDFERQERLGFPEFVFGEGKTIEQIAGILGKFLKQGTSCLVTRLQEEKAGPLLEKFPGSLHDPASCTFRLGENHPATGNGVVAIIAAGTSDAPVVAEADAVLRFLGTETRTFVDKGVAGIHRLLSSLPELKEADVVIAVAGFEGALPSVLSGLIRQPVIGVPTSIGYGVAHGGTAALHSMLASCANGLTVVNIDNGFGAAIAAQRILNLGRTTPSEKP
ncbi:MAG: nickel pincer cofactor biosynthesis protein LarB [Gemmatimonadales bacterium]|nr:nickel pincer cofactor biosynthesis protein LarB [Gemmatimonadales bacterium]